MDELIRANIQLKTGALQVKPARPE
jgi:hypothetical protein